MRKLTFRQLEVFVTVVEVGSFREAADRFGISQSSVSNHVSALEAALNARLFARQRGMLASPTERGVLAYREAKMLVDRFEGFTHLFAQGGRVGKRLKIGAHTFVVNLIGDALARYAAEHSDVAFGVEVGPFEFVINKIRREELDVGLVYTTGPVPGVESTPLWLEPLALYASRDHEIARNPGISAEELREYPLITVPRHTQMRTLLDETLLKIGISDCPIALEADSFAVVNQSLIRNLGFALLFKRPIDASPTRNQLVELDLPVPPAEARQIVSRSARNDPVILDCIDFILKSVPSVELA